MLPAAFYSQIDTRHNFGRNYSPQVCSVCLRSPPQNLVPTSNQTPVPGNLSERESKLIPIGNDLSRIVY